MRSRRNKSNSRRHTLETLEKRELLFAPVDQATLLGGLDSLADSFDRVETHAEYAQQIPGLSSSAGSVADFSQAVREGLITPLSSLLDQVNDVELADVTRLLSGYEASDGNTVTTIEAGSVSATEIDDASGAAIEITASITNTRSSAQSLDEFVDVGWIEWSADAPSVDVVATTEMAITFGVDLVSEEFYVELGEFTTNIDVNSSSVNSELTVGPVDASVSNGSITIDGTLVADFGGASLTANQLDGTAIGDLIEIEASGSLDATLPVEFTIGSFAGSETISWQDSILFDENIELPELAATGDLVNAIRIDQEDLAGFFSTIGTKLDELLGEDLPNWSNDFLPWVRGLKLPDLSGISEKIGDFVEDDLTDEDGRASFRTFEELRQQLADWTGRDAILSYLPNTSELTYEFEVAAPVNSSAIEMGVDESFGPLADIDVTGTVTASGEFVLAGVFGVDLTALQEDLTPGDITDDDSWSDHFYVDDLELTADIGVVSDAASAFARLGFVGLGIGNIGLAANATAALRLADDQATDGRITFKRLSELIVSDPTLLVESSTLSGDAEVALREMTVDGIPGLELDGGEITIGISDITDPSTFAFDVNSAAANINSLSTVSIDQWVELAGDVIALVDEMTEGGSWDEDLPGIGQSVNDLIDHAARLQQAIDSLLDTDAATIQGLGEELEALLEDALRISPESLDVLLSWQNESLEMTVDYSVTEQAMVPLSVDMAELIAASGSDSSVFDLLGDLVDVSGTTNITANASLDGSLVFGVDASEVLAGNSTDLAFYVDDSTGIDAELDVSAESLETSIALGPLGLFVREGSITIDADGDASTSGPALLSVGLKEVSDGRYSLADVSTIDMSDVEVVLDAGASIVLPLYFPTVSDPVGGSTIDNANAIIVGIGNVAGLFDSTDPNVVLQAPDVNSLVSDFDSRR